MRPVDLRGSVVGVAADARQSVTTYSTQTQRTQRPTEFFPIPRLRTEHGRMPSQGSAPVLVVGAGPTGLALALWLTKLGVRVRVIDKTADAAPYSQALGVHARTLEFYRQIGLADAVLEGGVRVPGANFWVRGSRRARIPLAQVGRGLTPYPFMVDFAQNEHERLLVDRLATLGVHVERNTELRRLEARPDGAHAILARDGGEEACDVSFLAGCDGAHSTVRESLGVDFRGATYSGLFYVADVVASGDAVNGEVNVDLDESDLLAIFPMKGERHIRLVGTVEASPDDDRDDLTFEDVSERILARMRLSIEQVNWFSPYRVHHRVASAFRRGRVFLLGDAAHVHSPVGAQGMNTGIGDAVNLAWKLAAVLRGAAPERMLETYEAERIAFARRLVETTDRVFTGASARGAMAAFLRTRVFPLLAPPVMRLPPVRRFAFRTVSQIGIEYRDSALSEGRAGGVHGGDRLPWVASVDNFAPLSSLAWQVHVYGEARAGVEEAATASGLAVHVFPWTAAMRDAGLRRGSLFVVRPDGYVGLASADGDPASIRAYVSARGLVPGAGDSR